MTEQLVAEEVTKTGAQEETAQEEVKEEAPPEKVAQEETSAEQTGEVKSESVSEEKDTSVKTEPVKTEPVKTGLDKTEAQLKKDRQANHFRLVASAKERLERENYRLEEDKRALTAKLEEQAARVEKQARLEAMEDIVDDTSVDETADTRVADTRTEESNAALRKEIAFIKQQNQEVLTRLATDSIVKKYSDFEAVVSAVNVSILKELDPEVTKQIIEEPDLYRKGIKAYEAIRKHKIYENAVEVAQNKETIINNIAKPRLTNSSPKMGTDETSVFANLNSKDYQNQLRKDLEESLERA